MESLPFSANELKIIFWAFSGGFMLNMLNLYEDQKRHKNMRKIKDRLYWVMFTFWPFAGAFLACLYLADGSVLRPLSAVIVGLTAPATLQNFAKITTDSRPPDGAEQ